MGLFDAIASSAANLTDNIVGMVNQNHQNKVNLRMMREQNAFNAEQAQIQRDWQQQMWGMNNAYNSPSAMISRALPQALTQMTDYMTSAASSTSNTAALTSVPSVTQSVLSLFLQTANAGDQPNARDDAGLPIVYGSCKLLDLLGNGLS